MVLQLEAYTLQSLNALSQLYEAEPDCGYWPSITDREAELWGPLLLHARLAGRESEDKLLAVVDKFSEEKAEIKSADSKIAQTIALLDAIAKHSGPTFTPGDLATTLAQSEAWGRTLADVKGRDDDSVRVSRAAKIGYFLRTFRLKGKKNSTGLMAYDRAVAIACLSAHVPQNPPNSPQAPSQSGWEMQPAENNASPEGTEATEGFGFQTPEGGNADHEPSERQGLSFFNSRSAVAVMPAAGATGTPKDEMVEGEI